MVVDPAGPPALWPPRLLERFASAPGSASSPRGGAGREPGEVVRRAGGDPESVRGEDVSAAPPRAPAARRVIELVGWWIGFGWPTWPACSTPSASCWGRGGPGRRPAGRRRRATYAELVEGATPPRRGDRAGAFGERAGAVGAATRRARAGCGDAHRRRAAHLPRHARRRLRRRGRGGGRRRGRPVLLRPHLAARPAGATRPRPFPVLGALATRLGPPRGAGGGPFLGTLVAGSAWCPTRCWPRSSRPGPPGTGAGHRGARHRRPVERAGERAYGIPSPRGRAACRAGRAGRQLVAAGLRVWVAGGPRGAPRRPGRRVRPSTCGRPTRRWWRRAPRSEALEVTWPAAARRLADRGDVLQLLQGAGATWRCSGGRSTSGSWWPPPAPRCRPIVGEAGHGP